MLPRTASLCSFNRMRHRKPNERTACLALPALPACLPARPADAPNLSYGQFVLFYSFIALANWRTLRTRLFRAWPLYSCVRRRGDRACVCVRACVYRFSSCSQCVRHVAQSTQSTRLVRSCHGRKPICVDPRTFYVVSLVRIRVPSPLCKPMIFLRMVDLTFLARFI